MKYLSIAFLAAVLAPPAYAQTHTDCNPMNGTCPLDIALGVKNYTIDFQKSTMTDRVWNTTAGNINYGTEGAEFTINEQGDSPTVKSNFHIFGGQVEVWMKAASGQGIISSIVLESDDLDEVDWEFMGGNKSFVQTNYFGKGNVSSAQAVYVPVDDIIDTWHNYTVAWSKEKLDWIIDGQVVRTLTYADAQGGQFFPQTPLDVRLGIWAGGDPKNPPGTIAWAGGKTTYSDGPFTMFVKSVRASDASTGTQYKYGDTSGSWDSIQTLNTAEAIKLDGENSDSVSQTTQQKWNSYSSGTKIAIIASVAGVLGVSLLVFAFCCIKQRRAGKRERILEDAKFEKSTAELMAWRAEKARERQAKMNATANVVPVGQQPYGYSQNNYSNNNNYARSVSTFGSSGKGYQRY